MLESGKRSRRGHSAHTGTDNHNVEFAFRMTSRHVVVPFPRSKQILVSRSIRLFDLDQSGVQRRTYHLSPSEGFESARTVDRTAVNAQSSHYKAEYRMYRMLTGNTIVSQDGGMAFSFLLPVTMHQNHSGRI